MSTPVDKDFAIQFASNLRNVMSAGYLQDVPVASSTQVYCHQQYEILVGEHREPLRKMNYTEFSVACTLLFPGTDNPMDTECPQSDLCFREPDESRVLLRHYARELLKRHGFSGKSKLALKCLRMSGEGSRGSQICSPDDKVESGVVGHLLVDYPFNFRGGNIHVTRGSRTESFDFSRNSQTDNQISLLFWHTGSLVTTEPLKKGFRAFLLCDVVIDTKGPAPLFLDPGSDIMKNFEESVVDRLDGSPQVLQILVRRFWDSPQTAPKWFTSLCNFKVDLYLRRLAKAKDSGVFYDETARSRAFWDGWKICRNFAGEGGMRRFCSKDLVDAFINYVMELKPRRN